MFASAVQPDASAAEAALMMPPDMYPASEEAGEAQPRRITADTFKALQAKLRAKKLAKVAAVDVPPASVEAIAPEPLPAPPDAAAWEALDQFTAADAAAFTPAQDLPPAAPEAAEAVYEATSAPPEPVAIVHPAEPPPAEWQDLLGSLQEKLGTSVVSILQDSRAADDPFLAPAAAPIAQDTAGLERAEALVPDAQAIEVVRALLDIMSAGNAAAQPQERTLAADTLLRLIPRLPARSLIALAERVAIMDVPPPMLVTSLIRDPRPDVAGPLLEKASNIPDTDLLAVVAENDHAKQKVIARRRHISPALTHALIETMDQSVLLTLLRNQGAEISHDDFHGFASLARLMPPLQAPLVTRANTPAPVAFELFWNLPPELRRFVLSRFLTDSENLNRILKIANAMDIGEAPADAQPGHRFPEKAHIEDVVAEIVGGNLTKAGQLLAKAGGICETTAQRVICDRDGEPLAVLMKAMGISRQHFGEIVAALQSAEQPMLSKDRNPLELQNIFDQLSFNKARMLLTYWDWSALQTGPYARNAV